MRSNSLNLSLNKLAKKGSRNPKNLNLQLSPSISSLNLQRQNSTEKGYSPALKLNNSPFENKRLDSPILPPNSPLIIRLRNISLTSPQGNERDMDTGYDSGFNSPIPLSPWATENLITSLENFSLVNNTISSPQPWHNSVSSLSSILPQQSPNMDIKKENEN
ncbi:hypothetical protein K502DRAFT_327899 [Neoconidiobolus thromboides FSU 785]|nr:hypothetical protein K502DRAFT_327899 [Neoconidiobolus thromboides FSU 785]